MNRKVLFIAPSAYPLGGVAVWLDYLTARLEQYDWQGVAGLVAGTTHNVNAYCASYPCLPLIKIYNPTGSHEGRLRAIERALLEHTPDLVVGVNIVDVYSAVQRVRLLGHPIKAAMALHGIDADLLADIKREAPSLDAVIASNRLACRLCIDLAGMPAERVLYAPYGVDIDRLSNFTRPQRKRPLSIVWIGRLEQAQKRINDLPNILASLDELGTDYVLRIVGDGPERAKILIALEPWIKNRRVEYLGVFPSSELGSKVYAHADALLLTSSWETGPIVIWEAMAAGVAVVTSRYVGSGLEDALHHEKNCLIFSVGDCIDAAHQIARLSVDAELSKSLIATGQNLVASRYSVSQSVQGWADCLDSILEMPFKQVCTPSLTPKCTGRLDRLIGVRAAETLRRALGITYHHIEPGGEWPHTAASGHDENDLLQFAAVLDIKNQN